MGKSVFDYLNSGFSKLFYFGFGVTCFSGGLLLAGLITGNPLNFLLTSVFGVVASIIFIVDITRFCVYEKSSGSIPKEDT